MHNLLSTLFTQEELDAFNKKEAEKKAHREKFEAEWKDWLKENQITAIAYQQMDYLFNLLERTKEDSVITIKLTKKNLNEIIQFSSSRYNDYKKSDYVRWCYEAVKNASPDTPLDSVGEATTGCFSPGAFGHGGKKGSSRFNAKFTTSGTYSMDVVFGMPFLILDNSKIVLFEGFEYNPVVKNKEIVEKYKLYKSGKKEDDIPF